MNPLRVQILSEIDAADSSTVTLPELAQAFNHEKHWRNWAAKWNLDIADRIHSVTFTRKPKA